jgi:hypothetical protein
MPQRIRIVEGNPQPAPPAPIPGCTTSLKFSQQSAMIARYETMAMPRPIEIRAGRVTIFARPGILAVASALTLDPPRDGSVANGGDDESVLEVWSLTSHAHTLTVASGISGGKKTITFGAIGANVKLIALAGVWHTAGLHGVKLS